MLHKPLTNQQGRYKHIFYILVKYTVIFSKLEAGKNKVYTASFCYPFSPHGENVRSLYPVHFKTWIKTGYISIYYLIVFFTFNLAGFHVRSLLLSFVFFTFNLIGFQCRTHYR